MHGEVLRDHARAIWLAGVAAVRSEVLVTRQVAVRDNRLLVCGCSRSLESIGRIVVVGAGKAGAGMAAAVENALGPAVVTRQVTGWVNVPADCVRPLARIHLHAARPAGLNEPTEEGVAGTRAILDLVGQLAEPDLCLVLLSGGGSALLPAPRPPLTLGDKQQVTRFLMRCGATITELNTVRKRLSLVKGGGLARACRAGQLVALIISDVVGDPLDVIASGPTCLDSHSDADALEILARYDGRPPEVPAAVFTALMRGTTTGNDPPTGAVRVENHIIGNNAMALAAAAAHARALGYHVLSLGDANQGEANAEGAALMRQCLALRADPSPRQLPICLLSGGEPVVKLVATNRPRRGGRNQQLALAGLVAALDAGLERIALLAGGTDGEDGPTDAAGAFVDDIVLSHMRAAGSDPREFLAINDAYGFFAPLGGLLKTGPTHTNVMDLRVALVAAPTP